MEAVPVAKTLGLTCPNCGTQLEDAIGPFWCPTCEEPISSWYFVAAALSTFARRRSA
jgi:rubrerythrin